MWQSPAQYPKAICRFMPLPVMATLMPTSRGIGLCTLSLQHIGVVIKVKLLEIPVEHNIARDDDDDVDDDEILCKY